ncbi:hypothetical protein GH733_002047 [Mirounga leonina]|nr:hypothetical protein GH733_002047 [Mirounga leonina]
MASHRALGCGTARGAAPSLAGLTPGRLQPPRLIHYQLPPALPSPCRQLSSRADSEQEPGVPVALSCNCLGSGHRRTRAGRPGSRDPWCGVSADTHQLAQHLPGRMGSLGAEASGQGLAPGPFCAGEPGMTPWPGPTALCLRPDSASPGLRAVACTSLQALLAPISHRQGSRKSTALAEGCGRSLPVGRVSREPGGGLCVPGSRAQGVGEGGAGGQAPACRPHSVGGGSGHSSLWPCELGAQPRLL